MTPSYVALLESGEFEDRVRHLESMLADCTVCPHECRVDRRSAVGICATGSNPVVASCTSHFGEEPVISGHHGSGTVFFANCNLRCVFCQNHEISQRPHHYHDTAITTDELADVFLDLQRQGCHNINWVSPSHQVPQLVRSLHRAACRGLRLPVVYNSNGFDAVEVLRLLEGVVDIYMPDLKYADSDSGLTCSRVADYPQHARSALEEMFRQVGDTWTKAPDGTLVRGLLIRILVLPNDLADVADTLRWVAETLSPKIGISLMAQYYPSHRATNVARHPLLARSISAGEWDRALAALEFHMDGDHHWVQDYRHAPQYYRPDFSDPAEPFADRKDFD